MSDLPGENDCIVAARRYMLELGWVLVPVRGPGCRKPKAPIYDGWPECRPTWEDLAELLALRPRAGIAVNLGASNLIDVEGDTPEGEALLDELCSGTEFPCYRSVKGKHRLFADDGRVSYNRIEALGVEFRAGQHISILPPSLHGSGEVRYEWVVSPFGVKPPPLLDSLYALYLKHPVKKPPAQARCADGGPRTNPFPFRDDLDYVLRHFDLMERAERAGLVFVCKRPDANGNVPCYVPDALRNGNPDEFPSGVFNVNNGRLRDFATGLNHRFFDFMAALTGKNWLELFQEYERTAGAKGGRPHSRRVCLPGPSDTPVERLTLDEARSRLQAYFRQELSRPPEPKRLHIIQGPPGLGKTHGLCRELARQGRKAVLLTLENRLAAVHSDLLTSFGSRSARRMPILRETPCPFPDEYEATARRGYQPSRSLPCRACHIGPRRCQYLLAFSALDGADQLCCAGVYHTHEAFYETYGNRDRQLLVFDENPVDLLLEPRAHRLKEWRAWARLVKSRFTRRARNVPPSVQGILGLVDWLTRAGRECLKGDARVQALPVPDDVRRPGLLKRPGLESWLNEAARDHGAGLPPNLYGDALYLLTEPGACVLLQKPSAKSRVSGDVVVRFRRKHRLPEDKEVFVLDATANQELLRALAPGWEVSVWECPPVEQKGRVVQIMDYDVSRNFIKKEVRRHRPHSPSWLAQVLDAILARARDAVLIGFKKAVTDRHPDYDFTRQIAHGEQFKQRFHYPCRGVEAAGDVLVVVGTPYKDQATVLELALAVHGPEGLPKTEYRRQVRQDGCFVAKNMGYGDERLRSIEEYVVSADLVQAVGRLRPLQNDVTVYVLSNALIPDWQVTQVCAAELFDLRLPLRRDAAANYERYAEEIVRRLDAGASVGNRDVCDALGIPLRSGRTYMSRFKKQHGERIEEDRNRIIWRK